MSTDRADRAERPESEPPAAAPDVVGRAHARAGAFRTERGLGVVFVDEAFVALLGISQEQALGQGWLEAIHADDRVRVAAAFERALTSDEVIDLECRCARAGGDELRLQVRAVPVRGDDGRVSGSLGSIEDVSDARRNELAAERFTMLTVAAHEWIGTLDAEGHVLDANAAARRGLALPDGDALQHVSAASLLDASPRDEFLREVVDALARDSTWTGHVTLRSLDARRVEVECTVIAHGGDGPQPGGPPTTYSFLARDVTDLHAVQRALTESEERFRLIAESSPTGIYFVGNDGLLAYANPRLAEIFGQPLIKLLGREVMDLVYDDDRPRVRDTGEMLAGQQRESHQEFRIERPSGELRWLRTSGAPVLDAHGALRGYVGSLVDTTDEHVAQRELRMLEQAVEATSDLVSFHDLDGRMFFANAAARAFLGVDQGEPLPEVGPDDYFDAPAAVRDAIRGALAESGRWSGEIELCGADGRRMPASVGLVAHHDEHGEVAYFSAMSRDISERRAAEAWFRSLAQHTPDLVAVVGANGRLLYVSPSVERLLGTPAEQMVGARLAEHLITEDQGVLDAVRPRLLEHPGEAVPLEMRLRHRDGTTRAFEGNATNLLDDPSVGGLVVNARDVTDRRDAESARRQSEAVLRAIVQASPLAIVALDGRGIVHVWNRACEQMFGYPSADVIGAVVPFVADADTDEFASLLASVFRGATVKGQQARFRTRDDAIVDVELALAPLRDASGRVVTAVAVIADVSEQKRAITALREREVRFRSLVQHASDMVSVLDRDGRVTYMSPSAWRFAGVDPEQRHGVSVVPPQAAPEDADRLRAMLTRLRTAPGATETGMFRFRAHDGSLRWIEMTATNLLDDPAVEGIVTNARDLTEREEGALALRDSESRLRDSEARYRAVVDDQAELLCRYLPDTTLTFVNRAFAQFYGRTTDELVGTPLIDLFPAIERPSELERLRRFGPGRELETYDDWEVAADGSKHWYQWTDRAFLDDDGEVIEFQSVGHDVTEERRAASLTAHQAEILEQVASGVPLDETLRTIAATLEDHFPRLLCAVTLLQPLDGKLHVAAAPTLPPAFVDALDGMAAGPHSCTAGAAAHRREAVATPEIANDPLWADQRDAALAAGVRSCWSSPIVAADGITVLGTLDLYSREPRMPEAEHRRIVSLVAHLASIAIERKAFEDRLAHQSMHDPLTGLPNRLLFLDRLGLAVARCRRTRAPVAVLFLDLDRFKNVNDGLGHDAGDELLVAVAHRLEGMLRPGDTVARFGGDEFTILCEDLPPDASSERSLEIARRLLASVAEPFVVRGAETFVSASIGIAHAVSGDERPEELLRDADAAMYHAKEAGRGRVEVFDDTMRARALVRHATENALHRALERGELRVFFQPIVALDDARCVGAEALVRWQHPERGLVAPAEFVPLAEETGLVVDLGAWVLEEAARHSARWQLERNEPFLVSINLSPRQLAQPDLAERVADVIERTGAVPQNLCFELTESAFMDDADAAIALIERIRALGVRFAIDDFGTGYSSLGYVKRFPVDIVKVDQAFVAGLGHDAGDAAIVSAVIGLGHALGLRVVAEGVETEEQLTELLALGCDEAQGYYFAPPQPVHDLHDLLGRTRTWRPPGARIIRDS